MLDNRTILVNLVIIPIVFSLLLIPSRARKGDSWLRNNRAVNLIWGAGLGFLLFQDYLHPIFTVFLANNFIFGGFVYALGVTFNLYDIKFPKRLFLVLLILNAAGFYIFSFPFNNILIRIFIIAGGIAFLGLYGTVIIQRSNAKRGDRTPEPVIFVFIFFALINIQRIITTLLLHRNIESIFSHDIATGFTLLGTAIFILSWNFVIHLKKNSLFRDELKKSWDLLQTTQEDVALLNAFYSDPAGGTTWRDLISKIFSIIENRFQVHHMAIYLKEEDADTLKVIEQYGLTGEVLDSISRLDISGSLSGAAFLSGERQSTDINNYFNPELKEVLSRAGFEKLESFPMSNGFEINGVLTIGLTAENVFTPSDRDSFQLICNQLGILLYNYRTHQQLTTSRESFKKLATIDPLTGIPNRRFFHQQMERELDLARRYDMPFSFFILDIDDFKNINDTYGHDTGDNVLREVAEILKDHSRKTDYIARYGGEEFVGLLTRTPVHMAEASIVRLLEKIRSMRILPVPDLRITVSLGLSAYSVDDGSFEDIIKRADAALYKVKKGNKNGYTIDR